MANTLKRYKFTLISDDRLCDDLDKEINRQIERVNEAEDHIIRRCQERSKFKFGNIRELSFRGGEINRLKENRQKRCDIIGETLGTWNDVYTLVNSIRPQKIEKL